MDVEQRKKMRALAMSALKDDPSSTWPRVAAEPGVVISLLDAIDERDQLRREVKRLREALQSIQKTSRERWQDDPYNVLCEVEHLTDEAIEKEGGKE